MDNKAQIEKAAREYVEKYPIRHIMSGMIERNYDDDLLEAFTAGYLAASKELQHRMDECERILANICNEEFEYAISHAHYCVGYCVSHGNEICDCHQRPLIDLLNRKKEYFEKYQIR